MTRVSIVAKTQAAADDLATALAEDDSIEVARAEALRFGYKPDPAVDVIIAWDVPAPSLPRSGPKIVLVSRDVTAPLRNPSIRAWLRTDAMASEIAAAAVAAHAGFYVLQGEQMLAAREDAYQNSEVDVVQEHLTSRETQVLRMMADGASNKEIAAELGISNNTVKFHVGQVLAKLGAGSRTEAVRIGIRRGLVLL